MPYAVWRTARRHQAAWYDLWCAYRLKKPLLPIQSVYWVHAVSVGEWWSILPWIERLLKERPGISILVTVHTPAAYRIIKARSDPRYSLSYIPYDLPDCWKLFFDHYQPKCLMSVGSEIWPNLYAVAQARACPIILINARISEKSLTRYQRYQAWLTPLWKPIRLVCAQSDYEAHKWQQLLSVPVLSLGDLKLEISPSSARELPLQIKRFVLCASTHEGEEELLGEAWQYWHSLDPGLGLMVAPRHPHRWDEVEQIFFKKGFSVLRRSSGSSWKSAKTIYLCDTLGELRDWMPYATWVCVGGSWVNCGGHNPLEPAVAGKAIMMGPYYENCRHAVEGLSTAGALLILPTHSELQEAGEKWITEPDLLKQAGVSGAQWLKKHQGATERVYRAFEKIGL